MRVSEYILNDIKPVSPDFPIERIIEQMGELRMAHLPVVQDGQFQGIVAEDDLLDIDDPKVPLSHHPHLLKAYSLSHTDHLYNAMRVIGDANLSLLPVLGDKEQYIGYLSPVEMLQDMGRQLTYNEQGSVIVLRVPVRDYHISQLAQIVESEDARIIGLQLLADGVDFLKLAIKINQKDISRIIKSFERFEYEIVELYHQSIFDDSASDRYESLMKYLNI